MSLPRQDAARKTAIASLYIQALRAGEALWFQVVSGSMTPTLNIGDRVRIEPVTAQDIHIGEIAALETGQGLVIHRIVRKEQKGLGIRFLEMGDVELRTNWVEEQAVIGRVALVYHDTIEINLRHPIAKRCGTVTAHLRYRLYLLHINKKFAVVRVVVRKCSRLVARACYGCIRIRSVSHV